MGKKKAKEKRKLHTLRHPEFAAMAGRWTKWRLCYEGSDAFREAYLEAYSKREDPDDFRRRTKLTYIPGHARSAINIIRNALAVQLPDVVRTGSEDYLTAMSEDVDTFKNNMSSFVAIEIAPWLLVQGKTFVVVDAPVAPTEGATRADDSGRPYLFTVKAEDMLSWAYDSEGRLSAALMRLYEDAVDPETGLVTEANLIYRYYRRLEAEQTFKGSPDSEPVVGPGVVVWEMDKDGKESSAPMLLPIDRVPVAEFRAVASLMSEIADHQISLLNLASTDMDFLWRGNFPIYVEQQSKATGTIRPAGSRRRSSQEELDEESVGDAGTPGAGPSDRQTNIGVGRGRGYKEGLNQPAFISPETKNIDASMKKQELLAQEIRVLVNLSLTSLSVKALEQSGKSKEADRVGEEAGLAYLGRVLESGERDIAKLWAMMEGGDPNATNVNYPQSYSLKTDEERIESSKRLLELVFAVPSESYQNRIYEIAMDELLRHHTTPDELKKMSDEIVAAPFFNGDKTQAELIAKDRLGALVSAETASKLRGYEEGEAEKAAAERVARVAEMTGAAGEGIV